ncbi:hypothetical protein E4U42_007084 [Claviceps africana]|uniref:BHLH domain-containing protein n=1 Tax=Claviceps africana TaxID=83212 RepID=A0A8K0J1J0_9HYPO|nr:hypothetical protein E4U42_007084 [Claviceps africana]
MNENAMRDSSVASTDPDQSSSRQTSQPAQDASTWSGASTGLGTFAFTTAPSNVSIPSFDPAIAAFADLSFTQPSATFMLDGQSEAFQAKDSHDKKRMKVESDTPALDSIDYWISFDDDLDKMGSFEIDYSKRPDFLSQNRPDMSSQMTPGLGSGLYSTAMAPFREEDFFDDSAFEQVLSDDEDMFEPTGDVNNKPAHLRDFSETQTSAESCASLFPRSEEMGTFGFGSRFASAVKDEPRKMGCGTSAPAPQYDEQRRLLEEALNSGKLPGALIPPNGFGIGFGAGMGGCKLPQDPGRKASSPHSQPSGAHDKSTSAKDSDMLDETELKKQTKKASATRPTALRKSTSSLQTPKVRSADRIAHNDVERKYRTNLKDKIAELRAAVPALQTCGGAEGDSEGGSAGGQQGGNKISKGTVLTKATEYIHQLEARNKAIIQEHQQLSRRLQAFETLLSANSQADMMMMPNHSMTLFDPRGFC